MLQEIILYQKQTDNVYNKNTKLLQSNKLMTNRNYSYGSSSKAKLATGSNELQKVADRAMEIANTRKGDCPDFGISSVRRTEEEQFDIFKVGRISLEGEWVIEQVELILTHSDGTRKKSVHQSGNAIDLFAYVDGIASYDAGQLAIIAGCFMQAASELGYQFRWGGHFRSISDSAHFELTLKP